MPRPIRKTKAASKRSASRSRGEGVWVTSMLLRDIDPEVARVLRTRAERSGRSLQQELHAALRRDARRNFDEAAALSAAWRERLRGREIPDVTDLIREDRSR
ncbi:MAG: hypothetical protein KF699_01955 [Phycisphaeraceae bacterium]|nr:hypothetical protein [Phycisphaeraceae bacterium]MBX3405979.1 hypothetical protein [Phycisphaeraceae bacterium]